MEVARQDQRDLPRDALRHAVVVDQDQVDGPGRGRHVGQHPLRGHPVQASDLGVVQRGGLVRREGEVPQPVDVESGDPVEGSVQDVGVRQLRHGLLERHGVVVPPDEQVGPSEGRDLRQDQLLRGRPERREVAGVDHEVHVEALGHLTGEVEPQRVQVDVGDVKDPDLGAVGQRGDRDGRVGPDGAVHDLLQLGPEVRDPAGGRAHRPDQLRGQGQRSRVPGGEERRRPEGGPHRELAAARRHQGGHAGHRDQLPPEPEHQEGKGEGAEHGSPERPRRVAPQAGQRIVLDLGDQPVGPLPSEFPGQGREADLLERGGESERSPVGVRGDPAQGRQVDVGQPPPVDGGQPDPERTHLHVPTRKQDQPQPAPGESDDHGQEEDREPAESRVRGHDARIYSMAPRAPPRDWIRPGAWRTR